MLFEIFLNSVSKSHQLLYKRNQGKEEYEKYKGKTGTYENINKIGIAS